GRRKIAAVRAFPMPTSTLATCVSSSRSRRTRWPPSSTMAITTVAPLFAASASAAAAIFLVALSVSTCLTGNSTGTAPTRPTSRRIPIRLRAVFMAALPVSGSIRLTNLHHVIVEWARHLFEPVRCARRNDDDVAHGEAPGLAPEDVLAADFIQGDRLSVHHC